jgi:MFS family permease
MADRAKKFFYGWWVVGAGFTIFFLIGGLTLYGFTAFFDPILLEMGWSRAETSLANSLRSVEGGITQPFIGVFIDRFGARKCILVGILLAGAAFILMSQLHSIYTFYVTFLLLAFGHGLGVGNAQYTAASNWFKRRRSLALGVVASGFGFSGLMTPVLIYLINNYGWRNALLIIGPGALIVGIPLALLIRHRPEPYGYYPDNDKPAEKKGAVSGAEIKQVIKTPVAEGMTVKECMATKTFWFLLFYSLFTGFGQSAMIVLIVPALVANGISKDIAGWAVTGMTGFSLIGRMGLSYVGDKYDKRWVLAFSAAIEAVGVFIFAYISSPWMIFPFLLCYGPGFGAQVPLIPAIQADCFGMKSFATVRGLLQAGTLLPGVVAPFFAGWLFDNYGNYNTAFIIYAAICVLAVPTMFLINIRPRKMETGALGAVH